MPTVSTIAVMIGKKANCCKQESYENAIFEKPVNNKHRNCLFQYELSFRCYIHRIFAVL